MRLSCAFASRATGEFRAAPEHLRRLWLQRMRKEEEEEGGGGREEEEKKKKKKK